MGPRVNTVPARLVWARPCPETGLEGVGAVLAVTARLAGKLERGAHLARCHLGPPPRGLVRRLCPRVPGSALPVTTAMAQSRAESHLLS